MRRTPRHALLLLLLLLLLHTWCWWWCRWGGGEVCKSVSKHVAQGYRGASSTRRQCTWDNNSAALGSSAAGLLVRARNAGGGSVDVVGVAAAIDHVVHIRRAFRTELFRTDIRAGLRSGCEKCRAAHGSDGNVTTAA